MYKLLKKKLMHMYIKKYIGNNLADIKINEYQIVVYISGGINNYYQYKQWIMPLKELNRVFKVILVVRNAKLFIFLKKQENYFPVVWLPTLNKLLNFYNSNNFSIILYINNNQKNFQSLIFNKSFHVHINHGESEKESMFSNQSKAYDYVFCAGDRAVQRYRDALLNFDESKYLKVGRPQLDFIEPFNFDKKNGKKIILYAPTWEGHHESMNYSSVAIYGVKLIKKLLKNSEYIIFYKPHSNIGNRRKDILNAHKNIIKMVSSASNGHVLIDTDINSIFSVVDFALFDNSSVIIDYLHVDKPALLFDIKHDPNLFYLSQCFTPITDNNISLVLKLIDYHIKNDPNREKRKEIKKFYLGDYKKGESMQKFIATIADIIDKLKN